MTPGYLDWAARVRHPQIDWPVLKPAKKPGDITFSPSPNHLENTAALLDAYGIVVRWNLMRHLLEIEIPGFEREQERADNDAIARIVELAERRGLAQKQVLDHLRILARSYHPVADWIASAPWDGTDRLGALFATIELAPTASPELARVLFDRWMVSCARAVMPPHPDDKPFTPQGVLTFQGPQGIGKTEWIKALAPPNRDWIAVGRIVDPHNRDSVQQATSFWILELGELDATYRKSDISALKAWVTQDRDVYRSAYDRRESHIPRKTVAAASVNPSYFLVDDTGNRRWWTIACASLHWQHGLDMQQVWAQVMVSAAEPWAMWWLTQDEKAALNASNAAHEIADPTVDDLWATWEIAAVQSTDVRITLTEIWQAMPGRENRARSKLESAALANALRAAGAENATMTHGCKTYRVRKRATDAYDAAHRQHRKRYGDD